MQRFSFPRCVLLPSFPPSPLSPPTASNYNETEVRLSTTTSKTWQRESRRQPRRRRGEMLPLHKNTQKWTRNWAIIGSAIFSGFWRLYIFSFPLLKAGNAVVLIDIVPESFVLKFNYQQPNFIIRVFVPFHWLAQPTPWSTHKAPCFHFKDPGQSKGHATVGTVLEPESNCAEQVEDVMSQNHSHEWTFHSTHYCICYMSQTTVLGLTSYKSNIWQ